MRCGSSGYAAPHVSPSDTVAKMTLGGTVSGLSDEDLRVPVNPAEHDDLSKILRHLNRTSEAGRRSVANSAATIAFLRAALDLTDELFSPQALPVESYAIPRPTLSYLSKPNVVKRAIRDFAGDESHPDAPTESKFRDRWRSQSDFLADFTAYALIGRHWSLHLALSERARTILTTDPDAFSSMVHAVALEDLKLVLDLPAYRFQLLAAASAQADSVSAEALSRMYRTLSDAWCSLYQAVFDQYGVVFRPGVTVNTFNIILQATAEGLGMRLLAGTNEEIISPNSARSILGTTALALFVAFIETGDRISLEDAADRYVQSRVTSP